MVTITKGDKTLVIPNGALRTYLEAGWNKEDLAKVDTKQTPKVTDSKKSDKKETPVEKAKVEEEPEEDVIYVDPEDLMEKPLEELDYDELKILAEYLGIDVKNMKSSKVLKAAIRDARK